MYHRRLNEFHATRVLLALVIAGGVGQKSRSSGFARG